MEASAIAPTKPLLAVNRPALRNVIGLSALMAAAAGIGLGAVIVESLPVLAVAGIAALASGAMAMRVRKEHLYLPADQAQADN